MRKVIHVLTDKNIGGAGRWLLSLLRCTDREKDEVKILLPEGSLLAPEVEALGFETLSLPGMIDRSWDRTSLRGMTALFRRERPEIVHVGASLTARVAARCAGVPVLVVTKHCAVQRGGILSRAAHGIADRLLSDRIVAVSQAVGEELAAAGTPKNRICVIHNGIIPCEPCADAAALRERFGFDDAYYWVGIAARLEKVKGVDLFLDAAQKLLSRRDDVRFAVFGTGSEEQVLKESVRALGDKIRFYGFCSQIEQALQALDVAVVSSRSEAFCLSAAEALSVGTAVAAFDVDGVHEVVREGETGLLVPAGDTAQLAEKIAILLADRSFRLQLGERGRRLVLSEFTAERMAQKTETLYGQLLREKGVVET